MPYDEAPNRFRKVLPLNVPKQDGEFRTHRQYYGLANLSDEKALLAAFVIVDVLKGFLTVTVYRQVGVDGTGDRSSVVIQHDVHGTVDPAWTGQQCDKAAPWCKGVR